MIIREISEVQVWHGITIKYAKILMKNYLYVIDPGRSIPVLRKLNLEFNDSVSGMSSEGLDVSQCQRPPTMSVACK